MEEVQLEYVGNGLFRCTSMRDVKAMDTAYNRGVLLKAKLSQPRSSKQNAYAHWLFRQALYNARWSREGITSEEEMKGHILIAIGHCSARRLPAKSITRAAARIMRQQVIRGFSEWAQDKETGEIICREPLPTHRLNVTEFSALLDKAITYICEVVVPGTKHEDWSAERFEESVK